MASSDRRGRKLRRALVETRSAWKALKNALTDLPLLKRDPASPPGSTMRWPRSRRASAASSPLVVRCTSLRDRLEGDRLQLAVLGQFKRGKSTFINALLGAPVLPIAVVPLTAVPIFISWASEPLVRVRFLDGREPEQFEAAEPDGIREFLFQFVAEEANPKNRFGVARVDLSYPAPILADGTVLIDTPGVGSTFHHNTEAALQVIPECDAVLFIASADPPITQTELDYLRRLKSKTERIFFILNKVDYIGAAERKSVAEFSAEGVGGKRTFSAGRQDFPRVGAQRTDRKTERRSQTTRRKRHRGDRGTSRPLPRERESQAARGRDQEQSRRHSLANRGGGEIASASASTPA